MQLKFKIPLKYNTVCKMRFLVFFIKFFQGLLHFSKSHNLINFEAGKAVQ